MDHGGIRETGKGTGVLGQIEFQAAPMNVAEAILSRGKDSVPAVVYKDTVVSHGELRQRVEQFARALLSRGHHKGDRIGIFSENNPFFVTAYLAVIRAGLVAVPFQTEVPAETFAKIVSDAGIKSVLVSQRFGRQLKPWTEAKGVSLLTETDLQSVNGAGSLPEIDPAQDLAALMFTSGSTGVPKGVMISHRNIECNTRDIVSYMQLTTDDRAMVVLPFHYCFGMSLLHTLLMAGGSVVLNNDFRLYPEPMLREMQQRECTGFAGVPSTYQLLLRKSRFRELPFPKLRWFQQAGGKLPNPFIAEIIGSFPQVRYCLMYGQTEATARLSYLPPERLNDKLGSIGQGLPSTKLEVIKPDGTAASPGSDELGEIVARGDNIALGYWNDREETAKYFRNGRLYTGDIARVDGDGFLFIVEREREMIKSGGNRVSAKEVEDVIAELPQVVEVAVLGVPHELLGEAIRAFVVLISGASLKPDDVKAHCRKRLPSFKTPEEVVFLKNMPHNSSGKVLKLKLKEMNGNGSPQPDASGRKVSSARGDA
jgi:acyl-CoA synthetase (AMP-forming)/AMP-acid ligase II